MQKIHNHSNCIELRLDELEDVNEKNLGHLISEINKKIVVSMRSIENGGKFNGSEKEKMNLLKKAAELGVDFIEIEHSFSAKNRLNLMKSAKRKTKFILSKYFSNHTPMQIDLIKKMEEMSKVKGTSIVKIVTSAKTPDDNLAIFELLKESKKLGINLISYCEGPLGRDSRILSLPLGGFLTYATSRKTIDLVKGEINIGEMAQIYTGLNFLL